MISRQNKLFGEIIKVRVVVVYDKTLFKIKAVVVFRQSNSFIKVLYY